MWAAACPTQAGDDTEALPAPCTAAFAAVLAANPAFALAGDLAGNYWGKVTSVAPVVTGKAAAVAAITIDYKWSGLGDGVAWGTTIKFATHEVTVTGANAPKVKPVWSAKLDALEPRLEGSLGSFVPIAGPLQAIPCTDNYPDWTMTIELVGGRKLALATNGSTLLGLGGPWQLTEHGATYLQMSPAIGDAALVVIDALKLPYGQPMASTCQGFDFQAAVLPP